MQRTYPLALALAVLISLSGAPSQSVAAAPRPNIILLMADDLGFGDLSCFNPDSPIQTPHLNDMAAAGLKFRRFYSAAPVCSPTRGSALTGRHPYRYGVYSANTGHLKQAEHTLPELLKQCGYRTGHFGKWHLGTLTTTIQDANRGGPRGKAHFSTPAMHGFDACLVTESKVPTWDPMLKPAQAPRTAWDFLQHRASGQPYGTRYWDISGQIETQNLLGDDSRVIMDRADAFVRDSVSQGHPFFCVVWFHAPHLPVVAGPEHVKPYAHLDVYTRNYYGCITALDEQVGRLRHTLRELEAADNTMVWFCSDNGPEGQSGKAPGSAGSLRGRKRSLYEGGVRVPGLLEWPARIPKARETNFAAVTSDYLPTILDALDLELPDQRPLDGVSLLPLIEGRSEQRKTAIGFQSSKQCALVGQRDKIYSGNQGKTWELYDLTTDTSEQRDISADHPELLQQMVDQFREWQTSCRASDQGLDYPR